MNEEEGDVPICTPNGLKIRLNPEEVESVLEPLVGYHSMEDILLDVETWEAMPTAVSIVVASAIAPFVLNWWDVIWIGAASHVVLHVVRGLTYLDAIRRLALILGSLPVLIACALGVPAYLAFAHGDYATATTLFVFNLAASFQVLELLMVFVPLGFFRVTVGLPPTSQEAVFMAVSNRRARKSGVRLDWSRYGGSETRVDSDR